MGPSGKSRAVLFVFDTKEGSFCPQKDFCPVKGRNFDAGMKHDVVI